MVKLIMDKSNPVPLVRIFGLVLVFPILTGTVIAQGSLPSVDADTYLSINPLGEMDTRITVTYPGNLYNQLKQLNVANPYAMFRGLAGENQPNFLVENFKIEFNDAQRQAVYHLNIPDAFRYQPEGWKFRIPDWFENCKALPGQDGVYTLTCHYTMANAMTAFETVTVNENITFSLPIGAKWSTMEPKESNLVYQLPIDWTFKDLRGWRNGMFILSALMLILGIGFWFVPLKHRAPVVEAQPVASPEALPRYVASQPSNQLPETRAFSPSAALPSGLRLVGIAGIVQGKTFEVSPSGAVIGRDPAQAHILVENPSVSRVQAQIRHIRGQYVLEHLSRSTSTLLNGQAVTQPMPLRPGDRIQIADVVFEIH